MLESEPLAAASASSPSPPPEPPRRVRFWHLHNSKSIFASSFNVVNNLSNEEIRTNLKIHAYRKKLLRADLTLASLAILSLLLGNIQTELSHQQPITSL